MNRILALLLALPLMLCAVCSGVDWGASQYLFNIAGQSAVLPNVAIDDKGNGVAAWINTTTTGAYTVQARYQSAGSIWGPITTLSSGLNSANLFTPAVSIDANGNALVAWNEYNAPSQNNIAQVAIKSAQGNWVIPSSGSQLSPNGSNAGGVVAAWDNNGNAIVGWSIFGGIFQAVAVDLTGANGVIVSVSGAQITSSANMVSNAKGEILATWISSTGGNGQNVQAAFKANGGLWTTPATISPTSEKAQLPTCAIDIYGNGLVSWSNDSGLPYTTLYSSQFSVQTGAWSATPTVVSLEALNPPLQEVGMDNYGNLSVIWIEHPTAQGVFSQVVLVATKTASAVPWTYGNFISDPLHKVRYCLSFAVDSSNDAVALWTYDTEPSTNYPGAVVGTSRPSCSFPTWETDTILAGGASGSPGYDPNACNIALNNIGSVTGVWAISNSIGSNGSIQYSNGTFAINDVTNLTGTQLINDFALVYEYYNQLTWSPSLSPGLAGYYIYQNGVVIATLGPSTTQIQFHDQVKGNPATYTVVAYSVTGTQSPGVTISIN